MGVVQNFALRYFYLVMHGFLQGIISQCFIYFLQFHYTDNEDSCMTVIPVHINVTIQNSF